MKIFVRANTNTSPSNIAHTISKWVDSLRKDPVGNQNCMLCTWAAEQRFRGIDAKPRAVYSPRDPIFSLDPKKLVVNPKIISDITMDSLTQEVQEAGSGARYYVHVNWSGSAGGHEFLVINQGGKVYVLDAQSGTFAPIDSNKGHEYFDDINSKNSYAFRLDNKELNKDYLQYNEDKYLVDWDEEADIKYMKDEGMI